MRRPRACRSCRHRISLVISKTKLTNGCSLRSAASLRYRRHARSSTSPVAQGAFAVIRGAMGPWGGPAPDGEGRLRPTSSDQADHGLANTSSSSLHSPNRAYSSSPAGLRISRRSGHDCARLPRLDGPRSFDQAPVIRRVGCCPYAALRFVTQYDTESPYSTRVQQAGGQGWSSRMSCLLSTACACRLPAERGPVSDRSSLRLRTA
jgi:hypothetical protein